MGFSIDARDLRWACGDADDSQDLCLHGDVVVRIGERTLEDDTLTVSAAGLYLLRSLTKDHVAGEGEHMIPHCGHAMYAREDGGSRSEDEDVSLTGCPIGLDWSVRHDGGEVVLTLDDGTEERMSVGSYREEVFRFADAIEDYYRSCAEKISFDDYARRGYEAFWREWHKRRGR